MTRILFERSGGFMGRTTNLVLNLEDLPEQEARELRRLVEQADFFHLDEDLAPSPARDDYSYRITVETDEGERTIRVRDASAPEGLRPLLQELSRRARLQRK
jgi:emfourin